MHNHGLKGVADRCGVCGFIRVGLKSAVIKRRRSDAPLCPMRSLEIKESRPELMAWGGSIMTEKNLAFSGRFGYLLTK